MLSSRVEVAHRTHQIKISKEMLHYSFNVLEELTDRLEINPMDVQGIGIIIRATSGTFDSIAGEAVVPNQNACKAEIYVSNVSLK